MVFMVVNIFDLLVVGMSTMSLIVTVFSTEAHPIISSSNRLDGRRLRMLTSLSRKALPSDSSMFLRQISKRRFQKRDQ
eukprot:6834155-Ditylum_brightwellii.AAC.1